MEIEIHINQEQLKRRTIGKKIKYSNTSMDTDQAGALNENTPEELQLFAKPRCRKSYIHH
jgi:hypothetical protein